MGKMKIARQKLHAPAVRPRMSVNECDDGDNTDVMQTGQEFTVVDKVYFKMVDIIKPFMLNLIV